MSTEKLGRAVLISNNGPMIFDGGSFNILFSVMSDYMDEHELYSHFNFDESGLALNHEEIPYLTGVFISDGASTSFDELYSVMGKLKLSKYDYNIEDYKDSLLFTFELPARGRFPKMKVSDIQSHHEKCQEVIEDAIGLYFDEDEKDQAQFIFEYSTFGQSASTEEDVKKELADFNGDSGDKNNPSVFDDHREWILVNKAFVMVSFVFER